MFKQWWHSCEQAWTWGLHDYSSSSFFNYHTASSGQVLTTIIGIIMYIVTRFKDEVFYVVTPKNINLHFIKISGVDIIQ